MNGNEKKWKPITPARKGHGSGRRLCEEDEVRIRESQQANGRRSYQITIGGDVMRGMRWMTGDRVIAVIADDGTLGLTRDNQGYGLSPTATKERDKKIGKSIRAIVKIPHCDALAAAVNLNGEDSKVFAPKYSDKGTVLELSE